MIPEQTQCLEEIRARAAARTPGKWGVKGDEYDYEVYVVEDPPQWGKLIIAENVNQGNGADADFIANAPTDIDALLALVERLDDVADELRKIAEAQERRAEQA